MTPCTCPICGGPMTVTFGPLSPSGTPIGVVGVCANGHPPLERMRDDRGELLK